MDNTSRWIRQCSIFVWLVLLQSPSGKLPEICPYTKSSYQGLFVSHSPSASHGIYVITLSLLSMVSKGHVYIVKAGDSIDLHCEFVAEYFNLFDNPVVWKKVQQGEEKQINMLGNLLPPFDNTKKFTTYFEAVKPRYTLGLTVLNVSQEDSGNYTCVVPSINATPLGSTTYRLYVPAPIKSLSLASTHQDLSVSVKQLRHREVNRPIFLQETVPSTLQCVSHSGYPAPLVELFIGRRNITSMFKVTEHTRLRGKIGLRTMEVFQEATTYDFIPSAEDDGQRLKCKVTVDGLGSNATLVKLHVNYAPVIKCYPASAVVGERRVNMHCDVRARPSVTSLYWIIDANGTRVSRDAAINDYWTSVRDIGDGTLQAKLYMDEARLPNFHSYTVVAENALESRRENVKLQQRFLHEPDDVVQKTSADSWKTTRSLGNTSTAKTALILCMCITLYLSMIINT